MVDGVKQVVQRADAAYAEPAHQVALRSPDPRAEQSNIDRQRADQQEKHRNKPQHFTLELNRSHQHADRQHDAHLDEAFELAVKALHCLHHVGGRFSAGGGAVRVA